MGFERYHRKTIRVADSTIAGGSVAIRPIAFILSPALQIIDIIPLTDPAIFVEQIVSLLGTFLAKQASTQNAPFWWCRKFSIAPSAASSSSSMKATGAAKLARLKTKARSSSNQIRVSENALTYISDDSALQRARQLLERRLLPMIYRA